MGEAFCHQSASIAFAQLSSGHAGG